jgi:hypothetical protein
LRFSKICRPSGKAHARPASVMEADMISPMAKRLALLSAGNHIDLLS